VPAAAMIARAPPEKQAMTIAMRVLEK